MLSAWQSLAFIAAGIIFLSLQYLFARKNFYIKREDWWPFIRTAFFYIYLAFVPEFWALQRLTATKVVIIYSITPFIAATLAYFLVSEKLTRLKVLGMIIGTLGVIPLLMTPDNSIATAEFFRISIAEGVLLLAVVAGAIADDLGRATLVELDPDLVGPPRAHVVLELELEVLVLAGLDLAVLEVTQPSAVDDE